MSYICPIYVPRTRSEVYIPAQLNHFFEAHTPDRLSDRLVNFVHNVLAQCFTVDLSELADGSYAYTILDELDAHELPRLDIRKIERFFPSFRCRDVWHVKETIAAFVNHTLVDMYNRACLNLDKLRHPDNRNLISTVPQITIKGGDDGTDETGVRASSVRFSDVPHQLEPRAHPSLTHARAAHAPVVTSRSMNSSRPLQLLP